MSSLLQSAVKTATVSKSTGNSSERNPAWYNRQKNTMISNLICHTDPVVRAAAVADSCCPTKQLQAALLIETNVVVLEAILRNPNLPVKSISEFAKDETRSQIFDENSDLIDYLTERIAPTS